MPEKVLNQIQYLCQQIPKVEWSGVLYYKVDGSIKDPKKMILSLEDILPMHKGTSAYTEYEFGEDYVNYMMENEHLEDCKMGHIHSHNTMGVFFSGTDWSELEDNAPNHNFYLSLIVNNFMDFCAKVCFIAQTNEQKEYNFVSKDENGEEYIYQAENYVVNTKKLIVFDCEIESPKNNIIITDSFKAEVDRIIKKATKEVITTKTTPSHVKTNNSWTSDNYNKSKSTSNNLTEFYMDEEFNEIKELTITEIDDIEVERFTLFVLNSGGSFESWDTIETVTKKYYEKNVSGHFVASNLINRYVSLYNRFFDLYTNKKDMKFFKDVLERFIEEINNEALTTREKWLEMLLNPVVKAFERYAENIEIFEIESID